MTSPSSLRYEYNFLSDGERIVYDALCTAADEWLNAKVEAVFSVSVPNEDGISADRAKAVLYAAQRDNPLMRTYLARVTISVDGDTVRFADGSNSYMPNVFDVRAQIYAIVSKRNSFFSTMPQGLTDYETYAFIALSLSDHISYSFAAEKTFNNYGQKDDCTKAVWAASGVYGGLINKSAVCYGYAETFQYLCHSAGLFCTTVNGTGLGGGKHRWNIIQLDDGYYHVDVTWTQTRLKNVPNPTEEQLEFLEWYKYRYFCLTDTQVKTDHIITEPLRPACTAEKYKYNGAM